MTVYGFKTIRNVSFLAKFGPFFGKKDSVKKTRSKKNSVKKTR